MECASPLRVLVGPLLAGLRSSRGHLRASRLQRGVVRSAGVCAAGLSALLLLASAGEARAREGGPDGRFAKRESSHFVLFQDVGHARRSGLRGADRFERDVLATLEAAYRALDAHLALRPPRKIQVFVYEPGVFDASFAWRFGFAVAGFHADAIRVRGDTLVTEPLKRTLHHELVHAALAAAAPSIAWPAWLNEGLAEWFEHRSVGLRGLSPSQWALLREADRSGAWIPIEALSAPSFAGLAASDARLAYLTSHALTDHLSRRRAPGGLPNLIATAVRMRDVEGALRRVYGLAPGELEAALRAELP